MWMSHSPGETKIEYRPAEKTTQHKLYKDMSKNKFALQPYI